MTLYERRQFLLELLRRQPGLRVPELARRMAVSEGTIRNDLDALEEQGRLSRVHLRGGAQGAGAVPGRFVRAAFSSQPGC